MTIFNDNGQYTVQINASSSYDNNNVQLNSFLQRQKDLAKQITEATAYDKYLLLQIKGPALSKNAPDILNTFINPVIDYLISNQYTSGCEYCGTFAEPVDCYEINDRPHNLCQKCKDEVLDSLRQNQQSVIARKSNLVAGLVGAFLGSLLGCILWVLIYKLGYIAGIAGAVIGICAMKGYELLGGHLDKKGVIGSVIIMIVMIYFANNVSWSWEIYDVFKADYDITFFDAYVSMKDVLIESDLMGSYYGDLIIGYLLTAVASFRNIMNAFKVSTGSFTMKKNK